MPPPLCPPILIGWDRQVIISGTRGARPLSPHAASGRKDDNAACLALARQGMFFLWASAACCAFASVPERAVPNSGLSLVNGSFETGGSQPEGWHLYPGASWVTATAYRGTRSLSGVSKREELICESDMVQLKAGADYRLSGRINCTSGLARLGVDLLDDHGHLISQHVAS